MRDSLKEAINFQAQIENLDDTNQKIRELEELRNDILGLSENELGAPLLWQKFVVECVHSCQNQIKSIHKKYHKAKFSKIPRTLTLSLLCCPHEEDHDQNKHPFVQMN